MKKLYLAAWAALVFLSQPAAAQTFPGSAVKVVVPFPPGGGVDLVARLLSAELSSRWGQPVVVENRAGAGGSIGAAAVAHAAPDGHTMLVTPSGVLVLAPHAFENPGYALKDLAPVSMLVSLPQILLVPQQSPFNTLGDLLAYARANPGKLNVGSSGKGTGQHMAVELLLNLAKVKMTHVPYRGNAPVTTALVAGEIDLMFGDPATLGFVKSGRLRALAVSTAKRVTALPDVPAIGEHVPGYEAASYYGLLVPAGTPEAIRSKIAQDVADAFAKPALRQRLAAESLEPMDPSLAFAGRFVANEARKWNDLIKQAGIVLR